MHSHIHCPPNRGKARRPIDEICLNIMIDGYSVFNGTDQVARQQLARLHAQLIPYGPVPRLGLAFMQNTYYRILPASGWLRCEAFSHQGNVIGFFTSAREEGSLLKSLGVGRFLKLG